MKQHLAFLLSFPSFGRPFLLGLNQTAVDDPCLCLDRAAESDRVGVSVLFLYPYRDPCNHGYPAHGVSRIGLLFFLGAGHLAGRLAGHFVADLST